MPVGATMPWPCAASASAQSFTDTQRGDIETIVRNYPLAHPEVLEEAMAELNKPHLRNVLPDPAEARRWYERAATLGATEAGARLQRLGAK